jgi:hypothetical protein
LPRKDGAEVGDQRFCGGDRKLMAGADFQPLDDSCPDRLIRPDPEDQRGDSRPYASGRGAGAPMVDDRAASRKDSCVIHRGHNLYVVEMWDLGEIACAEQINARSPSCAQALLIMATVSAGDAISMLPKPK